MRRLQVAISWRSVSCILRVVVLRQTYVDVVWNVRKILSVSQGFQIIGKIVFKQPTE